MYKARKGKNRDESSRVPFFSTPILHLSFGGGTTALAMVRGVEMDIGRGFEARWPVCFVGSQGVIYGIQYVIYTYRSVPALPGNG